MSNELSVVESLSPNDAAAAQPQAHPRYMLVTPELAAEWLERNHPFNRTVKAAQVDKYSRDILADRWKESSEHIAFAICTPPVDGYERGEYLIDGQHRLYAVIKANKAVHMWVSFNMPEEALLHCNTGKSRTVADVMKIAQGETRGGKLAALAKVYDILNGRPDRTLSATDVNDVIAAHQQETDWALNHVDRKNFNSAIILGCFGWAYPIDKTEVQNFFDAVTYADGIRAGSPEFKLREWLLLNKGRRGVRISRIEYAMRIYSCLATFLQGSKMGQFRVTAKGYDHIASKRDLPSEDRRWAKKAVASFYAKRKIDILEEE